MSLFIYFFFLACFIAWQIITGRREYEQRQRKAGQAAETKADETKKARPPAKTLRPGGDYRIWKRELTQ